MPSFDEVLGTEEDLVATTSRFPKTLHDRLRRASFETRLHINTLVNEGAILRLAMLDDSFARALAEADPGNDYTWDGLGTDQAHYRLMARKVLGLLAGVEYR